MPRHTDGAAQAAPSAAEQRTAAWDAALRLLSHRERSAAELRSRLRQKGFPDPVVEGVLERLAEVGLQDDRRFADRYAQEAAARGLAARRVQGELRRKGVDAETAAGATAARPEDEEARAREAAARRAARLRGLPAPAVARRLEGFLARRGFEPELSRRLARELAGPASDEPGDLPGPGSDAGVP